MSQVNIIDPVSPAASQAIGNAGDLLMQQAELAARTAMARAQIDSQERIEEARLKSAAELQKVQQEGFKDYQGFQATESEKQREFVQQQQLSIFEQQKELDATNAAHETAAIDRANNLQIQLKQADLRIARATADQEVELRKAREPLAKELAEAQAEIIAASTAYDSASTEFDANIKGMNDQLEGIIAGIGTTEGLGAEMAGMALAKAAQAVNDYDQLDEVSATEAYKAELVNAAEQVFADQGHLNQQMRPKFRQMMLSLLSHDGKTLMDEDLGRVGAEVADLYAEIAADDPTAGVAVAAFVRSLGTIADKEELENKSSIAIDAKELGGAMGRAFGTGKPDKNRLSAMNAAFGKVGRRARDNFNVAGPRTIDADVMSLALEKLNEFSRRGATYSELESEFEESNALPPAVEKRLMAWYKRYGVDRAAAKKEEAISRKGTGEKRQREVASQLDMLDAKAGAGSFGDVYQQQIDELDKLLR